jgi:hypothetical protein
MTSRRSLFIAAPVLAGAPSVTRPALAQAAQEPAKQADFLFVQTARRVSFDRTTGRISLHDVSPVTLFFSDRPERIAGNMRTAAFVPFWSKGKDSFLSDPPNADISILEGETLRQVVAVLQAPRLEGEVLSYGAKVLQGEVPAAGSDVSVFIDVIGMPLTPFSFAGAARRGYRRAVMFR